MPQRLQGSLRFVVYNTVSVSIAARTLHVVSNVTSSVLSSLHGLDYLTRLIQFKIRFPKSSDRKTCHKNGHPIKDDINVAILDK